MSDQLSLRERDTRALFWRLAGAAEAIELLLTARQVRCPPELMNQFMTLRDHGLAFRSDEDSSLFRAHTKLRLFVEHAKGMVSPLHELDENHEALLNKCAKLHAQYRWALDAGEDGESELDEFMSWAWALGETIDTSLSRFDAHLSSDFGRAKTFRQREVLNKEAVAQASNMANWLAALAASPLRQSLAEESSYAKLLEAFDEALFSRGKMARRIERCAQCVQRLREKLNATRMASRRHELLAKAAALDERGFHPLPSDTFDVPEADLLRAAELAPKFAREAPARFNPLLAQHARSGVRAAAKAGRWAKDFEATLAPAVSKSSAPPGSLRPGVAALPPKPLLRTLDALLDDLFSLGGRLSICSWLRSRHEAGLDLDVSAAAFLAWTCAQEPSFHARRDAKLTRMTKLGASLFDPATLMDAEFEPSLQEELV
jgi:hypothetical protein